MSRPRLDHADAWPIALAAALRIHELPGCAGPDDLADRMAARTDSEGGCGSLDNGARYLYRCDRRGVTFDAGPSYTWHELAAALWPAVAPRIDQAAAVAALWRDLTNEHGATYVESINRRTNWLAAWADFDAHDRHHWHRLARALDAAILDDVARPERADALTLF